MLLAKKQKSNKKNCWKLDASAIGAEPSGQHGHALQDAVSNNIIIIHLVVNN